MKRMTIAGVWVAVALGCVDAQAAEQLSGRFIETGPAAVVLPPTGLVYHVAQAVKPPVIDGRDDEWTTVPAMALDRKEQAGRNWNGPADLSGSLRLLWDSSDLYFCLTVRDDVHHAPNGDRSWWENDCCQFAFDPHLNGPAGGYDPDELSYLVGDSPKGPVLVSYRTPGTGHEVETPVPGSAVRMTARPDGTRVFEWTMPWPRLAPVSPALLGRSGFSFTLNDNDGQGFKSAVFWTPGIIWGQNASRFGELVFDGAADARPALLGLRPENRIAGTESNSYWLTTPGAAPWDSARLLVQSPRALTAEARIAVYRQDERKPVATGTLRHELPAGRPAVFAWDVSALPNGRYEIVYEAPALQAEPSPRLRFYRLNIDALRAQRDALRARFRTDQPWDDMADASPLLRRHRGMVAAAVEAMADDRWTLGVNNKDSREQHLGMLAYAADMAGAIERGRDFLGEQRGVFWSAYYCRADGSGQRFVVSLPTDFHPDRSYPLFVHMHGAGGVPTPGDVGQRAAMPYIEVQPWGRGVRGSYRGFGELDILDVISHMREWYRIDPDRIYATGASMGGRGSWRIPSRHPDLFAGAGPVCGWSDELPLENLRNVPVLNQHGGQDWTVPIDQSRFGVSRLHQLGYAVWHHELPESGHSVTGLYPERDWLLTLRRNPRPEAVTFTCRRPEPPFNRAYWVTVRELADPHRPARVQAHAAGAGKAQSLSLGLDNVAALEIDTALLPVDPRGGLLIQVNRAFIPYAGPLPERLFVLPDGDAWTVTNRWTPAAAGRPYRAGAAANLVTDEPLMVVYGSRAPEEHVAILRRTALELSRHAGFGTETMSGGFPVRADRDVTDDQIRRFNLILVGGTNDNMLTARVLAGAPIEITPAGELRAGRRPPVSLAGAGLCLLCRNPLAPERLAYVVGTETRGPAAAAWYGRGTELLAGMLNDEPGDAADLVVQRLDGAFRRRMQYTHGWQWLDRPGADRPAPAAFADPIAMTKATLTVIRRTARADYAFGWGVEKPTPAYESPAYTLADMAVVHNPGQTLVGRIAGSALLELRERLAAKGEAITVPEIQSATIETGRLYRVAIQPDASWILTKLQRNLSDVECGPDWRPEDVWGEIGFLGR